MSNLLALICLSIHSAYKITLTYTPGVLLAPQPIPQDTIPIWTNLPPSLGKGQIKGLPPSPLHVSLFLTPPAHMKLLCKWKVFPSLVVLSAVWHWFRGTTGRVTFRKTAEWRPFAKAFFPHPLATHPSFASIFNFLVGRQMKPIFSLRTNGRSRTSSAMSFQRTPGRYRGCSNTSLTDSSWWGRGSSLFLIFHSPALTFTELLSLAATQWPAVITTCGWIKDPPHINEFLSLFPEESNTRTVQGSSPNWVTSESEVIRGPSFCFFDWPHFLDSSGTWGSCKGLSQHTSKWFGQGSSSNLKPQNKEINRLVFHISPQTSFSAQYVLS